MLGWGLRIDDDVDMLNRFLKFAATDLWRIRLKEQSRPRSFLIRSLRIVVLAVRGFDEDKCLLRASALTFFTLLSIVPVLAMSFGIAKGFGMEDKVAELIQQNMQGQEEAVARIIDFSRNTLEEAKGSVIAGVGVVLLMWTVIRMLSNIESSFNHIWGIRNHRSFVRKFTDYLSFILVCPILLIMSSSITVLINAQLEKVAFLSFLQPLGSVTLKAASLTMIWMLFSFIYQIMPNTRVKITSALLAGVVAGATFQFFQWVYVEFQIGVSRYGAIYGSFAALPLFLIWLQVSWLVVLFGAEICFAHQNVHTYEFEPDCLAVSHDYKSLLSVYVTWYLVQRFRRGEPPSTGADVSAALEIPVRLVRQILHELVEAGVLMRIDQEEDKTYSYHPARDSDGMTMKFVLEALNKHGSNHIPGIESPALQRLRQSLESFEHQIGPSPGNMLLKDIAVPRNGESQIVESRKEFPQDG